MDMNNFRIMRILPPHFMETTGRDLSRQAYDKMGNWLLINLQSVMIKTRNMLKNMVMRGPLMVAWLLLCLSGCLTMDISDTGYNQRMNKIKIGMTKQEFVSLFPEAIPSGAKQYPTGVVEAFEINIKYPVPSFTPPGSMDRNVLTQVEERPQWFYFFKDRLIQYGRPGDWPQDPEKLLRYGKI